MTRRLARTIGRAAAALALAATAAAAGPLPDRARAETVEVRPGHLQAALGGTSAGDTLVLGPGVHRGNFVVDTAGLTLRGKDGAVLDGGGGTVLRVDAPRVTVTGLTFRGSGTDLQAEDSGIFVSKAGEEARILSNRLEGNLMGVNLKGPRNALVKGNTIVGLREGHMSERGNGVHVWNAPGSRVIGNDIRYGRDGIFVTTSLKNRFHGNRMRDLRYGVHYMYTNKSEVSGNVSVGNHAGYAIMYSKHIDARGNLSLRDRDHGLMLNFANYSEIEDNAVLDGGGKCLFVYNSNFNAVRRNRLQGCGIGIHFTAGSQGNKVFENAFAGNRTQVKYVGTTHHEWAENGRGNYWSDHAAFDLDGDGVADRPYRPNGLVDQMLWRHPRAKLLLSSPAVRLLRWAQSQFPALLPGGVVDPAPLMDPPRPSAMRLRGAAS